MKLFFKKLVRFNTKKINKLEKHSNNIYNVITMLLLKIEVEQKCICKGLQNGVVVMKRVQILMVLIGCILLLTGLVVHQSLGVIFLIIGVTMILFGIIKETAKK